ncbi:uncharacterized protein BT62DRAFT_1073442 [Guyanagaster necrorhizus]|uniref:Uncharacterized protein n=1 Tax=Guyanagaster necrorhizus TaxID=856835 RepID=A0A9P7W166_9AGAR|nr:uncharacterized protein BT62DRAFT_1073442 [Guyanagaster necrorhizus MCA 3950]KAG7450074.1 hypothetical protein BT62DRAFT_1073442 [Guyanagaster necrorhizus MCA 3950]
MAQCSASENSVAMQQYSIRPESRHTFEVLQQLPHYTPSTECASLPPVTATMLASTSGDANPLSTAAAPLLLSHCNVLYRPSGVITLPEGTLASDTCTQRRSRTLPHPQARSPHLWPDRVVLLIILRSTCSRQRLRARTCLSMAAEIYGCQRPISWLGSPCLCPRNDCFHASTTGISVLTCEQTASSSTGQYTSTKPSDFTTESDTSNLRALGEDDSESVYHGMNSSR